ncbi:hypothetical protein ACJX0J_024033, partial [Zea mays]
FAQQHRIVIVQALFFSLLLPAGQEGNEKSNYNMCLVAIWAWILSIFNLTF